MQFTVEKLDGRHTGHERWKYRVYMLQYVLYQFSNDRFKDYHDFRVWMTEQYGPSCERNYYINTAEAHKAFKGHGFFNPPWCWHIDTEKQDLYIYVRDDATLSNIQLKWS